MSIQSKDPTLVLDMRFMTLNAAGQMQDFSGYGLNGTLVNFDGDDSEFEDGHLGQCVNLPAGPANKYFHVGDNLGFTFQDFSWEFWAQPNIVGTLMLFNKGQFNTDGYSCNLGAAGEFQVWSSQGGAAQTTVSANGVYSAQNIHQFVLVRDGALFRLYIDGVEVAYAAQPAVINPLTNNRNCNIGIFFDATSFDFDGCINRVRCWQRALGDAEIYKRYIHAKRL